MINTPDRIIVIDFSVFIHAGFAVWQKMQPNCPPATYWGLSSIIATLSKVGVSPEDLVIFAIDSRPSWRSQFEKEYKANREPLPNEVREQFVWLKNQLNEKTNWIIIEVGSGIEADDIAPSLVKYFKEAKEIILCSSDHDWEQNWALSDKVKIFSLKTKEWKIRPDNYNVYSEIAKMLKKETSDNLTTTVINESEFDTRQMCVDLTKLPEWVEKLCFDTFDKIELKNIFPETVPFKSLQERFSNLYSDQSKVIDYEKQKLKKEKRVVRNKIKKKNS
jgi:hypothetical protein